MRKLAESRFDVRVATARVSPAEYPRNNDESDTVAAAVDRLCAELGWLNGERGPLGNVIPEGAKVLIKPNFVLHENQGGWGIEPLVTHQSLVRAATRAALDAGPSEVVVGDAPLQSCDFIELLGLTGLDRWANHLLRSEPRFRGIRDFRRTICRIQNGVRFASENLQPEERFVLFDLAEESLLEPVSDDRQSFRVTRYDPRLMAQTHAPGRHQYLIAKDVLEADVVVNLPKLKTHKKAGVTCALKNLIGINGNKEYLPHHRMGGASGGGDCYPGGSPIKRAIEYTLDRQNMAESVEAERIWNGVAVNLGRVARLAGDRFGTEGSWSGNDTIWRTCLDLNRILLYGRLDGSLDQSPQRRVIHIVDAVIAGQGEGPVAPKPLSLGLLVAGQNAAAVDWVGATLLGFDPAAVPVVREAFGSFDFPLTSFRPADVNVSGALGTGPVREIARAWASPEEISYPIGWLDAVRSNNGDNRSDVADIE